MSRICTVGRKYLTPFLSFFSPPFFFRKGLEFAERAVSVDSSCGMAFLQKGILSNALLEYASTRGRPHGLRRHVVSRHHIVPILCSVFVFHFSSFVPFQAPVPFHFCACVRARMRYGALCLSSLDSRRLSLPLTRRISISVLNQSN